VLVHYIVIKYTSCDTVVFDYIPFSKLSISCCWDRRERDIGKKLLKEIKNISEGWK